jgi:hypothetical protein
MKLFPIDVFTPNEFPEHTYIERPKENLEAKLRNALMTPNVVVSISGPSKSGKTVLAKRLVGETNLIQVFGAEVTSGSDLWARVLDWMDVPGSVSEQSTSGSASRVGGEAGGKGGFFVAEASAKTSVDHTRLSGAATTTTRSDVGLARVVREIAKSDFVVFLDDFHYIPPEAQSDVAKQLKAAGEQGIKICTATVPHRADNVVRQNPELRGRLAQVDTTFWSPIELQEIATIGFGKLQVAIDPEITLQLAMEACGSPQLMQRICLDICFGLQIEREYNEPTKLTLLPAQIQNILQQSSTHSDFATMVTNMHAGPKKRGSERRLHKLIDGSEGDVYRVVLMALAHGAPLMELPYRVLMDRIDRVCTGDGPAASSVVPTCRHIAGIAKRIAPLERVLEWDDEGVSGTMSIVDPYFLFYLRRSRKLESLGNVNIQNDAATDAQLSLGDLKGS